MFTKNNWNEFIEKMDSGELCEINDDIFFYYLGVLPPIFMAKEMVVGGVNRMRNFLFAEGMERMTAFWIDDNRYFCQKTNKMNPCW